MAKPIHIAIVTIPAFSHQASIIEFSKNLIHHHNHFHITIIFPTINSPLPATLTLLKSLPSSITYTFLPPINKLNLPQNLSPAVQIQLAVSQSMPSFHNTISSLSSSSSSTTIPLVALVSDPFANESLLVAKEFNLLSYIYFPPSAMTLSLFIHFPKLDQEISSEFRDYSETIQLPGCVPIHGIDLPEHFQDRSSLAYELILQRCKRFNLADGFLVNSFMKMEEKTMEALEEQHKDSVFLVGPIIQNGSDNDSGSDLECFKWLKKQSSNSVLYVSFGSGGTLSQEQVNELAFGLELSGQKFLWVLRAPSDSSNEAYLGAKNDDDPLSFLPKGFLERTKEQGLVLPNWAPQTQILSHGSVGGFLTHCGWNSVLESIVLGVPMIVWPLFAEQKMNAVLLCDQVKVAMRIKFGEDGLVGRDEIGKVVKRLMLDGRENGIRERIQELKDDAIDALKKDGSSTKAIFQFGNRLERLVRDI